MVIKLIIKGIEIILEYFFFVTLVDIWLMGGLSLRFKRPSHQEWQLITKPNRIAIQNGNECSGYATAYVLRHLGISVQGRMIYECITNKMKNGCVYPKGIIHVFAQYGIKATYCRGNMETLMHELDQGTPVIVLIKVNPRKSLLHYVPVVGYDDQQIYIAESLSELINCESAYYNRVVPRAVFKKLWHTAMLKMPFYSYTYITITSS